MAALPRRFAKRFVNDCRPDHVVDVSLQDFHAEFICQNIQLDFWVAERSPMLISTESKSTFCIVLKNVKGSILWYVSVFLRRHSRRSTRSSPGRLVELCCD